MLDFDIQKFSSNFGLMSKADKDKLDYLYNNAVVSFQVDSSNTSLMSAAGNVVAVIPAQLSGENVSRLKADPQLSLSASSIEIRMVESSDVTVTRLGNGAVTATFISGDDKMLSVYVNGTTITCTGHAPTTATYRIDVAETSDYNAASATLTVTVTNEMYTPDVPDDLDTKVAPNLTLDKYTLELSTIGETDTVIATFAGNGTLSITAIDPYYYSATVNGNSINFRCYGEPPTADSTETFVVTLSETDDYQSDTATVSCLIYNARPDTPGTPAPASTDTAIPLEINTYYTGEAWEGDFAAFAEELQTAITEDESTWLENAELHVEGHFIETPYVFTFPNGTASAYTENPDVFFRASNFNNEFTEDNEYIVIYAPMTGEESSAEEFTWYTADSVQVDNGGLTFPMCGFDFDAYSYVMVAVLESGE